MCHAHMHHYYVMMGELRGEHPTYHLILLSCVSISNNNDDVQVSCSHYYLRKTPCQRLWGHLLLCSPVGPEATPSQVN